MKVSKLEIKNFRGIRSARLSFPDHAVLIGDNNTGKSTILEALDLVLGPDRLSRRPPVDEHDFHLGQYAPTAIPVGEDSPPTTAEAAGKPVPQSSILMAAHGVWTKARAISLIGDPDQDWIAIRAVVEQSACSRMQKVAADVRNVRLLDRGTQLRQGLAQDWRDFGKYQRALEITRQSFVREHFATTHKSETGVIVMNMHKAKGKQFDEVIIFEGWPRRVRRQIVANPDRIVRSNETAGSTTQARQNFRVSVTRAKQRTTIMTPKDDICVLLRSS